LHGKVGVSSALGVSLTPPLSFRPEDRRFAVFSLAVGAEGREVVGGANDGCVYVYDRQAMRRVLRVPAHEDDVNAVALGDPPGQLLLSGGDDGVCRAWDRRCLPEGPALSLAGHRDGVTFLHARGDGRYVVSNSKDQSAKLWDLRRPSGPAALAAARRAVARQSWDYRWQRAPRNVWPAGATPLPGDASLVTFRGHSVLHTLLRCRLAPPGGAPVMAAGSAEGGGCLVRGRGFGASGVFGRDFGGILGKFGKWDVARLNRKWAGFNPYPFGAFTGFNTPESHWSRPLFFPLPQYTDVITGRVLRRLTNHSACVRDVSWSPSGDWLASSSWDGTVRLWDYRDPRRDDDDDDGKRAGLGGRGAGPGGEGRATPTNKSNPPPIPPPSPLPPPPHLSPSRPPSPPPPLCPWAASSSGGEREREKKTPPRPPSYGAERLGGARPWPWGSAAVGAALLALCRGAAALLALPAFPRAHALLLGALVGLGPLLRGRGDPHSLLASPHNRLEARLTSSAAAWTWLLIGSLLVASHPWLRPPRSSALRALARLAVGLALARAGRALGHALEAATGSCQSETPQGLLLLPLGDPASCRGAGHRWEGFSPAPQAFALVHCGLGLAEEAAALGRSLYGAKMAAGEAKMAAGYYGGEEGSKRAAGYDVREEAKMAAGYYGGEEARMAPRLKMAAGYDGGEGAKMAAGRGWAWPRPPWRPIGFEWAGPPHSNEGWAGPGGYGWSGHLGRPFWGRRGGHLDSGSHLEPGRHFYSGRRWESGHFDPHGGHFDPHGGHFEGGHFVPQGGHLGHPARHFDSGCPLDSGRHFEAPAHHFPPSPRHLEAPPAALSVLYLLGVALLVTWHLLLVVTLTYRHTWARNAAGAALGWACWVVTYRGWYRWAWSPGPPGWG
ncbi:LOW QUALITY PROTEIN: DDB1- and CUL4-associated factor 11, partial [Chamaea fasciata]|uniref:LOW QUALITY PROTEIN: DDB1- and CUL4-associated factor 11 n=1 Tax=Chamaea fasciata TaxID=190680 RepID=UPI00336A436B